MKKEKKDITSYETRLKRVLLCGLFCAVYSIFLLIDGIINNASLYHYTFTGLIFIAALVFIISYFKLSKKK